MSYETETTPLPPTSSPFPRPGVALAVTVGIMALYLVGLSLVVSMGSLLSRQLDPASVVSIGPSEITPLFFLLSVLLGQFLFLFLPTLIASTWSTFSRATLLRLRRPSAKTFLFTFVGMLGALTLAKVWMVVQGDYFVPDIMREWYAHEMSDAEAMTRAIKTAGNPILLVSALLSISIAPGICEEFLYRGYLQRSLEHRFRPATSILLTALLFGAVHLQPINAIGLAGIGAFLGYVAWSTGSIWPAVFGHAMNNGVQIIASHFAPDVGETVTYASAVSGAHPSQLLAAAMFGVALLLFAMRGLQRSRRKHWGDDPPRGFVESMDDGL